MKRDGLTLLETMVALVILGLVVLGYLELFGGTARIAESSRMWSRAVAYAEEALEDVKLDPSNATTRSSPEILEAGFTRRVDSRSWSDSIALVTVTVGLPGGGEFALRRLVKAQ